MSKALQALKKSYKTKLASEQGELHKLDVPVELLGTQVYARAMITANRKNRVFHAMETGQLAFCAELIVQCALDEDGKHLFSSGERSEMMTHCDSDDIELLAGKLSVLVFGEDDVEQIITRESAEEPGTTLEESVATKNSKKTTNS